MRTEMSQATITAPAAVIAAAKTVEKDLLTAARVHSANWVEGTELSATGELIIEAK
jgi:hypothetical protein